MESAHAYLLQCLGQPYGVEVDGAIQSPSVNLLQLAVGRYRHASQTLCPQSSHGNVSDARRQCDDLGIRAVEGLLPDGPDIVGYTVVFCFFRNLNVFLSHVEVVVFVPVGDGGLFECLVEFVADSVDFYRSCSYLIVEIEVGKLVVSVADAKVHLTLSQFGIEDFSPFFTAFHACHGQEAVFSVFQSVAYGEAAVSLVVASAIVAYCHSVPILHLYCQFNLIGKAVVDVDLCGQCLLLVIILEVRCLIGNKTFAIALVFTDVEKDVLIEVVSGRGRQIVSVGLSSPSHIKMEISVGIVSVAYKFVRSASATTSIENGSSGSQFISE